MNQPKILVFCTVSPLPIDRGDRIRLYQTLTQLSQIGHVRLLYVDRGWESTDCDFSQELPNVEFCAVKVSKQEAILESLKAVLSLRPYAIYRFITNRVRLAFQEQLEIYQPDLVWGLPLHVYPLLKYVKTAKKVVDTIDSVSFFYDLADRHQKVSLLQQIGRNLQFNLTKYEQKSIQASDQFIVCSNPNIQHLQSLHGEIPNVSIIYTRVADEILAQQQLWQFDEQKPCRLLFVGHLKYVPNNLAVRYIAEQILPVLSTKLDRFECVICGKGHEQLQQELQHIPNLLFTGFVEDLAEAYRSASILVSPVPYASGVQNKVIEAMALGLPVVMSNQTALANEMAPGIEILACNTPAEYADAIVKISTDRHLAEQLSHAGRQLIDRRHTAAGQLASFQQIVTKTLTN